MEGGAQWAGNAPLPGPHQRRDVEGGVRPNAPSPTAAAQRHAASSGAMPQAIRADAIAGLAEAVEGQMQLSMADIKRQMAENIQRSIAATMRPMHQILVEGVTTGVNASIDQLGNRVTRVEERMEASTNANAELISQLQASHDRLLERVQQMAESIEAVGKIRPYTMPGAITRDGPREAFDAAIDRTIARIHVERNSSVELAAIRAVLEPVLAKADLKESDEKSELCGDFGADFVLRFIGHVDLAQHRSDHFLTMLHPSRNTGIYVDYRVRTPAGNEVRLFIGEDTNKAQLKLKKEAKILEQVMRDVHPDAFSRMHGERPRLSVARKTGAIWWDGAMVGAMCVAYEGPTALEFDLEFLADKDIDIVEIKNKFLRTDRMRPGKARFSRV